VQIFLVAVRRVCEHQPKHEARQSWRADRLPFNPGSAATGPGRRPPQRPKPKWVIPCFRNRIFCSISIGQDETTAGRSGPCGGGAWAVGLASLICRPERGKIAFVSIESEDQQRHETPYFQRFCPISVPFSASETSSAHLQMLPKHRRITARSPARDQQFTATSRGAKIFEATARAIERSPSAA
jgi:hypothetical protein